MCHVAAMGGPFNPNYIDKPLSNKLAEAAQLIDLTESKYTYQCGC